jgi:hypothetical protein
LPPARNCRSSTNTPRPSRQKTPFTGTDSSAALAWASVLEWERVAGTYGFQPLRAGLASSRVHVVSRKFVVVLAVMAIVLLIFSLVTRFFPGSVVAIVLGIYALVVLTKPPGTTAA